MDLKDKKILITGGSLGIGKAAAKLLKESGAHVGITGRDEKRILQAAEETNAFPITADVGEPKDVEKTYKLFMGEFGGLDCLINNAGIGRRALVEELTWDKFQEVFRVNVFGAALMAAEAAKIFKAQNHGNIINIGSTSGLKGGPKSSIYGASKFALRGMTQSWQAELRPFNVRVTLLNPSEVATAFGDKDRKERTAPPNKLRSEEIAYTIKAVLEMDDRGFIPEFSVWASNPFD